MSFDPQLQQAIAAHMQYLRDLGIYDFYRRDTDILIEPTPEEPVIPPRQPVSTAAAHRFICCSAQPCRSVARDPIRNR